MRQLGEGGMGVVFDAFDRERGERVALKTLTERDPEHLLRLKREFRVLTDLSHPNLVALYDLFVDGEQCFFTMELLEGQHLIDYCAGDELRLRAVLPQIAQAIQALHDAGVVHRDIKPSNIMVTESGRAVLLDFGVSAELGPNVRDHARGDVVGTVDYMAPEQSAGERPGFAADWYSFGVLVFEALTGRLPFEGKPLAVMLAKIQNQAPAASDLAPDAPADLVALCRDLLGRDPGRRPHGAEILRRVGAPQQREGTRSSMVGAPFVGRHAELARLTPLIDRSAGGAAVVLIEGESGIGKSALVGELLICMRAKFPDMVVLHSRCYERETVTYNALDGLVDELSSYWRGLDEDRAAALLPGGAALLPRLFPVLGRVPAVAMAERGDVEGAPREIRRQAIAQLRSVLATMGRERALALWIDDMQWVDPDSVQLLEDLLAPPDQPPLMLVLTARPRDVQSGDDLGRLLAAAGDRARRLSLGRLPATEAIELATAHLPRGMADQAAAVARESRGNPFFIGQLASYLQTVETTGLARIGLDAVLTARLRKLPDRARRLLQLIAVARIPTPRNVFARASQLPLSELSNDLRLLRVARMTESGGTRRSDYVRPYHDRVTAAVLDGIGEEHRRELHRRLAVALEEWSEVAPERLSLHWHGAGELRKASSHALRAAHDAAGRFDFDRAAALYQLAAELGDHEPHIERKLWVLRAEMLVNAGRPGDAADTFLAAAKMAEPALALDLRGRAAQQLLSGGYIPRGLEELEGVLGELGLSLAPTPRRALWSLLWRRLGVRLRGLKFKERPPSEITPAELSRADVCWTVATGLGVVDVIRGADYGARLLRLALDLGEPLRLTRALCLEASLAASMGSHARADKLSAMARAAARKSHSRYAEGLVDLMLGMIDYLNNRWQSSIAHLDSAVHLLEQQRDHATLWEIDQAQLFAVFDLTWLGDLGQLRERAETYLVTADRLGDRYLSTGLRTRTGILALAAGEPERALGESEAAIRDWSRGHEGYQLQHAFARTTVGEVALYTGRLDRVDEVLAEVAALDDAMLSRVPIVRCEDHFLRGRLLLARARSRPGGASDAVRYARTAAALGRTLARMSHPPIAAPLGRLLAGAVALELGDREGARAALEDALGGFERLSSELYAQPTRHVLGHLVGGSRGEALRAQARAWCDEHGVVDPERFLAMVLPHRRSSL